jgi:hypothetical protein
VHRLARWAPLLILVVVALFTLVRREPAPPDPVDIRAESIRYEAIADLVAASDVIIEGTVVAVGEGRAITDPENPRSGIRTQLAEVEVQRSASADGDAPALVIVEQEARLLDGAPITVNGVAPLELGHHVVLLLISGDSEEFPYTTPVNEQGVFQVIDGEVTAADPTGTIGANLDGQPVEHLRAALDLSLTPAD